MTELDQILTPKAITERSKATLRMSEFMALDLDKYIALKESHEDLKHALEYVQRTIEFESIQDYFHEKIINNALKRAKKL